MLRDTVAKACKGCGGGLLALSGGLDSTVIASALRGRCTDAVAVISRDFVATDQTYSQLAARELGLRLDVVGATGPEILDGVRETVRILGNFNDIEIRNSVAMYLAIKRAADRGHSAIITGDGADELFAGYGFMVSKSGPALEAELDRMLDVMHFPSHEIGRALGVEVRSPFLDPDVVELARSLPASLKVREEGGKRHGKWVLRKAFEGHIPRQIAWRPKSAMQDGSGTAGLTGLFDAVIGEKEYVAKYLAAKKLGVVIRSKESMHYYTVYAELHGPHPRGTVEPCPYCGSETVGSRFCRMCGAYPV